MRKILLMAYIPCILLCACSKSNSTKMPMKKIDVYANYENNLVTLNYSSDIKLDNVKMLSKSTNEKIGKLLIGDELEVYYKDDNCTEIDYAYVKEVKDIVLKVEHAVIPGSDRTVEIFALGNQNIRLDYSDISYVINEDLSYTSIQELADCYKNLYATYKEEDCKINGSDYETIKINAIYSYNPRG